MDQDFCERPWKRHRGLLAHHDPSHYYFRYAHGAKTWNEESHFAGIAGHRITMGKNDGDAFDLRPTFQYAIYIIVAFVLGLVTVDSRALDLLTEFPKKLALHTSHFCPDPKEEEAQVQREQPGCALVIRAFELGYTKESGRLRQKAISQTATKCLPFTSVG
ncbi:MAG: hypothetical protein R3C68_00505 [Myxococcota bacterium]